MPAPDNEIVSTDLGAALAGEVGRFEVTLPNGIRFVVTVGPGHSLDHILPLMDDPDARPFRIRKMLDSVAGNV